MQINNYIVIGASSGGVEALQCLLRELPAEFESPILTVVHLAPNSMNYLPRLLRPETSLTVEVAHNNQQLRPACVYVAPADSHMLLETNSISLHKGPHENRSRPAVDPLFRSAAVAHGPRVIGVILSGYLDDGTAGLDAVKQYGGTAIVQDPNDALVPDMPGSAIKYVDIGHCAPADEIGRLLTRITADSPTAACV